MIQRLQQSFQDMGALLAFVEVIPGSPGDDIDLMLQELLQHLLQVQHLGLAVHDAEHVHAEGILQLGMLIELVQDHIGIHILPELDVDLRIGALAGGIVDIGNAVDLLLLHQISNLLNHAGAIHQIGQLLHHNAVLAVLHGLNFTHGPHLHLAAAGAIGLLDASSAENLGACGEIRSLDNAEKLLHGGFPVLYAVFNDAVHGLHHLTKVVGRDIGGHTDGNAGGAVHQKVREAGRQYGGLIVLVGEVGLEIHGILVDAVQHLRCEPGHLRLGVSHGCR